MLGVVWTGRDEWRRRLGVATVKRLTMGVKPDEEAPGSEKRTRREERLGVLEGIGDEGMSGSGLMLLRRDRLIAMGR